MPRADSSLTVQEVSGSISYRGDHKSIYGHLEPSDYANFLRTVKRQRFHTLKHTMQSQEQHYNMSLQTLYMLKLDFDPFSGRCRSLISSRMIWEKGFLLQITHDPLYDVISTFGSQMEVKP